MPRPRKDARARAQKLADDLELGQWLAKERARTGPQTPDDLQDLTREIDALVDAHHADTTRLQQDADAKSLTFGAPRNVRKLRPARNLSLFVAEAQPTLF